MTIPAYSNKKQAVQYIQKGHGATNPAHTKLDTYWTVKILGASTKPLKAVGSILALNLLIYELLL
jgi:hypothetical protein